MPRASALALLGVAISGCASAASALGAQQKLRAASAMTPSIAYWVYCSDCTALSPTPTLVETYESGACWPTAPGSKYKFTSVACSADGAAVTQSYFNDAHCRGAASAADKYPVGVCQKPSHDYDPVFKATCAPAGSPPPFGEWISDAYFADPRCAPSSKVYTDYHPVGCHENCAQSYSLGVVNTTAYRYDFGCDKTCPHNDYCGNGDLGALNKCVKDEYSPLYRMLHAFV